MKTNYAELVMKRRPLPIGIDDLSFHIPSLYLDIRDLAGARGIPFEKLSMGLGLQKMALTDVHEDAATMAAEAISELMMRNQLRPEQIGRVYMGTESALDDAKPTATYAVEMVQERLGGSFAHCDVVDLTFACIGAVDAMESCLDWIAAERERIAIVVASDIAKYELDSTGEYTQGAGAVAVLLRWNPRLLVIPRQFGISMSSVHDFYKPRREQFSETPVFDGPFSNQCYQNRMSEALAHFRRLSGASEPALSDRWERMIFHLPYSFHGKRIYVEEFIQERKAAGGWDAICSKNGIAEPSALVSAELQAMDKSWQAYLKSVSQSAEYRQFVSKKLEKAQRGSSEVGNLYTASIFMALLSTLAADAAEGSRLSGKRFGFIAYGSGSKSKVFEGIVQKGWETVASRFKLFERLSQRRSVDYETYDRLHRHQLPQSVFPQEGCFALHSVGQQGTELGARFYGQFHLNGRAVVQRKAQVPAH
jgi:hydroxymethylglutaryl-CoA synthase